MKWLSLKSIRNWILKFKVSWTTRYHKKSEQISMKRKCLRIKPWNWNLKWIDQKIFISRVRKLFCKPLFFHYFESRSNLQLNLQELFQAFKILSISSWLFEAIFLWKMDEYLILKRDSWTRKNVEVSMERIRSRFWFYRSHSKHLQSTASVDRIGRPWSTITQPTIDFGNNILFEFQFRKCFGIVLSSYRETEIPPTMFFHLLHVHPFFFRKC